MIVGFPGETAEDFEETLSLTEAAEYHSMFSFKYSPRPNTLASKRLTDDVGEADKTARIVELQSLQRGIQTRLHERAVGSTVEVLIDSASRRHAAEISGRSGGNTVVNCAVPGLVRAHPVLGQSELRNTEDLRIGNDREASQWIGRTVHVHVRRAGPHSLWGEAVVSNVRGHQPPPR
jgi:tRNA A37 methylthiotransferase MiaB